MDKLRSKAKELLESNAVQVVIGYEKGNSQKSRPVFIKSADKVDKLIYDENCHHNLAVYLTRQEMRHTGKMAVVAPLNVLKAIIILAHEHQIVEGNFIALCAEKEEIIEFTTFKEIEKYIAEHPTTYKAEDKAMLEKLNAMSSDERFNFWNEELSRCFKCYACRSACPMCYCHACAVDCNKPQWINVAPHQLGNYEWQMMRAMHLAGRCIDCGACADACPLDIPINLLTYQINKGLEKDFGFYAAASATQEYVLSTYKVDDKENFIS